MVVISKKKKITIINVIFHLSSMYIIYIILKKTYLSLEEKNLNIPNLISNYFRFALGILVIFINIFFTSLYYFKFPFFENLKINNLKWPWEEDKKKFMKKLPKIISLYLFNQVIVSNFFFLYLPKFYKPRTFKKKNSSISFFFFTNFNLYFY